MLTGRYENLGCNCLYTQLNQYCTGSAVNNLDMLLPAQSQCTFASCDLGCQADQENP